MYVIKNGTVYTMNSDAPIQADILIQDGKIISMGKDLSADGADVIDASGKIITPGFVDAHSHVGGVHTMTEEDLNELSNPVTAQLDALYGIIPTDPMFEETIRQGITTSCITPGSGNVVCGWAVAYKSAGEHRLVKDPVALKAAMGINPKGVYAARKQAPMTRMGIANILKKYFSDVKDYMKKKEDALQDPEKMPPYDLSLEHGIPVLKKEIPLKVHSYMHDITTVVEIAKEFDFLVTIDHAQGASDYYDLLCDEHVKGVIYGPICAPLFPGEGGKIDFECCKGLDDRNVLISVMTDSPVTPKNILIYQMGEAVRRGMDPVRALAMVTSNAAKIIGIDDRVGTIEQGKDADLLIWDKMPVTATDAVLEKVLIDGKVVFEENV